MEKREIGKEEIAICWRAICIQKNNCRPERAWLEERPATLPLRAVIIPAAVAVSPARRDYPATVSPALYSFSTARVVFVF